MGGQYYIGSFPWISSSERVCSDGSCPLFHPGCCHAKPSCEWGPTSLGVSFQLREGSKRAPHSSGSEPKCSKWNRVDGIKETRSRACLIPIARCPAVWGNAGQNISMTSFESPAIRSIPYTAGKMIPTRYLLGTSFDIGWSRPARSRMAGTEGTNRHLLTIWTSNGRMAPMPLAGPGEKHCLDLNWTLTALCRRLPNGLEPPQGSIGSAQLHSLKV